MLARSRGSQSGVCGNPLCVYVAVVQVPTKEVEYKTVYKRRALKEAVVEEVYPPSITVKAVHSDVPRHLRCPCLIHLHVSGAKSGRLTFPVEVSEKECECVSLVCGTCLRIMKIHTVVLITVKVHPSKLFMLARLPCSLT